MMFGASALGTAPLAGFIESPVTAGSGSDGGSGFVQADRGRLAFMLLEATLSLYPTGENGEAVLDQPVWWGACANNLQLQHDLTELLVSRTGSRHRRAFHTDEQHRIQVERTWVVPAAGLVDARPARNQRYVLVMVWQDEPTGIWLRRIFYGVTWQTRAMESQGVLQFLDRQSFRAEYFRDDTGSNGYTPPPPPGVEQQLAFFLDGRLDNNTYFMGRYAFGGSLRIEEATVIATAPTGTNHVLALEIGGVTVETIPIPAGTGEVQTNVAFSNVGAVAGQSVRVRVQSGPANEGDRSELAAVVLRVTPLV